ncbi:MAG: nucleotide-binding protein [Patescibacteria group bacterium]|nr:nucleotide-binding protein [Patescibacteria group bacterium]
MNKKIKKQSKKNQIETIKNSKRTYISQSDIPRYQLSQALRVANAIADNYGKKPTRPLRVAEAMEVLPASSNFRMLCGASIAYGLTEGGYNANLISLTPLAKRIVAPTVDGDDLSAKQEAILKPKIIREFLTKYDTSSLPAEKIGYNVLEEMGVPTVKTKETFDLILKSAKEVGFIREMKGKNFVDLSVTSGTKENNNGETVSPDESENITDEIGDQNNLDLAPSDDQTKETMKQTGDVKKRLQRVFITHGKNQAFISPIKKFLIFGGFEPVVAVERQTTSQPVPEKIIGEMQSCGAAIIHIEAEQKLISTKGKEQVILNPNVLVEIGAAMALYGKRFVLLVKEGVDLPSNLQGLYQVRYSNSSLSSGETIKLLEAINDIKNHSLPGFLKGNQDSI